MKSIKIQNIQDTIIKGIRYETADKRENNKCGYFDWNPTSLTANFKSTKISGGIVNFWHHSFNFTEVETHIDSEIFHVMNGDAIMIFADVVHNAVIEDSVQIVRVPAGTRLIIEPGKGHYAPILAEGGEGIMFVACPEMECYFHQLADEVVGVIE